MDVQRNFPSFRSRNSEVSPILEPIQTSGLVDVSPSNSVLFTYFRDGIIASSLKLSNKTKSIKLFRILATSSENYVVLPSMGVLAGKDSAFAWKKVEILMRNQKDVEKRLKDKFLIETLETLMKMSDFKEEDLQNINVAEVWKDKNDFSVRHQKNVLGVSLIYSNETSENTINGGQIARFLRKNPENNEFSAQKPALLELGNEDFDSDYKRFRPTRLTKSHLSVNSVITESRRNASIFTDNVKDTNFEENYRQKFEKLKKIADEQAENLETMFRERDDYLNQINKLKFVYENKVVKANPHVFLKLGTMSSVKVWQMLLICTFFLILGSFISFIRL